MQETWSPRLSELTKKTGHDLPLIKSRLECPLLIALFIRCCLCLKFGPSLETTSCHWHLSLPLQRWFHISFHLSMLINDGWILMQVVRETQWQGSSRKETKIRQTIERCQNTKGKQSMRATRLPSLFLWHQRKIDREKAGRRCACLGMPEKEHWRKAKQETQERSEARDTDIERRRITSRSPCFLILNSPFDEDREGTFSTTSSLRETSPSLLSFHVLFYSSVSCVSLIPPSTSMCPLFL